MARNGCSTKPCRSTSPFCEARPPIPKETLRSSASASTSTISPWRWQSRTQAGWSSSRWSGSPGRNRSTRVTSWCRVPSLIASYWRDPSITIRPTARPTTPPLAARSAFRSTARSRCHSTCAKSSRGGAPRNLDQVRSSISASVCLRASHRSRLRSASPRPSR